MTALWHIRQTLKAHQGDCYEVDDFRVKIAQVFQGADVKGVLIEVCGFVSHIEALRPSISQRTLIQVQRRWSILHASTLLKGNLSSETL